MSITDNIIEDKVVTKAENDVALIKHNSGDEFRNYFETTEDDQLDPARLDKFFAEADQPFIEQFVYDVNTGVQEHFAKGDDDLQNRGYYQRALPLLERFQEHQAKAGRKDFAVLEAKKNAEINAAWASRKKDHFLPHFKGEKQLEQVPEKHRDRAINVQFIAEANELDPNHVNKNYELFRAQLWNGYEMEGKPTDKGLRDRIKQDLVKADDRQEFIRDIAKQAESKAINGDSMLWGSEQDESFKDDLVKHGVSKKEASAIFRNVARNSVREFKVAGPYGVKLADAISKSEGVDLKYDNNSDKSSDSLDILIGKIATLPKEERNRVLYVASKVAEKSGVSTDSYFEALGLTIKRHFKDYPNTVIAGFVKKTGDDTHEDADTFDKIEKLKKAHYEKFGYDFIEKNKDKSANSKEVQAFFKSQDKFRNAERALTSANRRELWHDIRDVRNTIRKVELQREEGLLKSMQQGSIDTVSSILPIAAMALPFGLGNATNALYYSEEDDHSMRREYPEMDANTREIIAGFSGSAKALTNKIAVGKIFSKAPLTASLMKRLGARGAIASGLGRIFKGGAWEYTEERAQEAILPLVHEIGATLSKDVPELKEDAWDKVIYGTNEDGSLREKTKLNALYHPRIFFAVLPLVTLAAGGSTIRDKMGADKFRESLSSEDQLRMVGLKLEEAQEIQKMNEAGSINAHVEFDKIMKSKTPDQIKSASQEALEDGALERTIEAEVMQNGTDAQKKAYGEAKQAFEELTEAKRRVNGDIRNTNDGRIEVVFPEAHKKVNEYYQTEQEAYEAYTSAIEEYDMQQSSEIEAREAQIEELRSSGINSLEDANKAVADHLSDAHEGSETKFIDKDFTLDKAIKQGQMTIEQAQERVEIAIRETGQALTVQTARILGSNQIKKDGKGYINRIYKGGNIATVFEESAEGYLGMVIEDGGLSYDFFAQNIAEYQRETGEQLVSDVNNISEQEVIEGFSKLARAHVYNERESSSFPPAIRAILGAFKHFFNSVLDTASNLLQLKQEGKLDGDFEMHLNKAVGLDEDTIKNNQQKRYEREIMEEMLDPETELSYIMKGKIPRPSDLAENETLKGEVQRIWDELTNFDRKGRRYAGKANAWFADKGSNRTLHRAREHANEEGFAFETEAEMLEALEASITGDSQYPSGQASFSISPAQDAHLKPLFDQLDKLSNKSETSENTEIDFKRDELAEEIDEGVYLYDYKLSSKLNTVDARLEEMLSFETSDIESRDLDGEEANYVISELEKEGLKPTVSFLVNIGEESNKFDSLRKAKDYIKEYVKDESSNKKEYEIGASVRGAWLEFIHNKGWLMENGEVLFPSKQKFDEMGMPIDEKLVLATTGSIYFNLDDGSKISLRDHGVSQFREMQFGEVDEAIFTDFTDSSILKSSLLKLISFLEKKATTAISSDLDNQDAKAYNTVAAKKNLPKTNDPSTSFSISPAQDASYLSAVDSDETLRKEAQLKIILDNNPAFDDYHTWIRQISDIKNFEESLNDSDYKEYYEAGEDFDDSYSAEMVEEALRSGVITVYSSYPIKQGIFVSPSTMEAEQYAGDGELYSKEVNISDVAWIDPTQGQYAKVNQPSFSITPAEDASYLSAVDSGDMEKAQAMVDKAAKRAGYDSPKVYHGTAGKFDIFGNKGGTTKAKSAEVAFFFTNDERTANAYAAYAAVDLPVDDLIRRAEEAADKGDWDLYDELTLESEEMANYERSFKRKEDNARLITAYLKGDFMEFDAEGETPQGLSIEGDTDKGLTDLLRQAEYDGKNGVIFRNLDDAIGLHDVVADHYAVFNPNQIKSADPVTYDEQGNVIPLSERFNEKDDRISYSISPTQDPLIAKIQKLIRDPETKATVFKVMATRLSKLKAKQNAKLTKRLFDGEGELSSHEELLDSIAQLDAIIAVLPREVRGQIRGYKKLAELKTVKGRTNYLIKRMERVDDALEKYMVKSYKEAIKKMFDKSKPKSKNKASDAGQSKIGAIGHLIAEAAQAASTMNAEQAELRAAEIRREVEDPQPEEQQELEDRAYVTEMFADMESADSNRLDQLLDILQSNWDEGRKEWVKVLAERKEWKDSTIEKARQAFGVSVRNDGDTTSKTGREDGLIKKMAKDALNIFHVGDLLREGDKNESDSVWKEFNDDLRRAKNKNENLDLKHREEMKSVIVRIFGFKRNKQAQVQDRLRVLSKQVKQTGVTKTQEYELEIATNQKDLDKAEKAFQAGEDIVIRGNTLTKSEYQEFVTGWQDAVANGYEPAGRKLFRYSLMRNEGERSSIGEMSQLDMLKDWLSIQQKDLKEKYEKNGYDEQYRDELDSALEDDVKELGLWMQNKLKDDQEIQQALHREEYGLALRLIDNYFPAVFEHGGKQSTTLTMDGVEIGQSTNRPSAHKLRVNHNSRPKKQNAFAVFNGHIMQRNFWESHAEVLRKWASVIRDKNMQDYILRSKGQTTLNLLNRWLSETENQGADVAKVHIETDHLWRSIGKGMALGILGGRISTIFKNLIASTNVVLSTNFTDLLRGFSPELRNDVRDLYESDTFQRRLKMGATVATRHAFEARASGRLELATAVRAAEYPVQAINLADTLSNMTFALAYRAKIKELELGGMNEAEAKEKALDHVDDLVDRFAQPTSRLSKSLWENTRTPESVFLVQFMSEARKVVTINMLALRKIFTGKGVGNRSDASRQLMTSIIVNSLLVHAVNSLMSAFVKGEGDDPEEEFINQLTDGKIIASAMMTESFAGIPLLGDGWKMIVNKSLGQKTYDSSSNPATKLAKSASSAYSLLTDDKDRTASEMTDSILRVLQGFGSISPYTSIFSQGANVARDGLGFYNNTLDKGLSEEDSKQLSVDRITKKYSAIKKVDADAYKEARKIEKKQISSARHEAIEQYLQDYLMELPEKRRKMVIDELKEKKSVPKDVMKRVEREVIQ